jgi:hypothetical protein
MAEAGLRGALLAAVNGYDDAGFGGGGGSGGW